MVEIKMADLIKAKKLRLAAKGWVTRSITQANKLFDAEQVSQEEVELMIEEFNVRLSSLQEAQASVEMCLDEDDIEQSGKHKQPELLSLSIESDSLLRQLLLFQK